MIEVNGLSKRYHLATGLRTLLSGEADRVIRAVEDVSFVIRPGEVLGLVGESGSGKSTTGKLLVGLEEPSAGAIRIDGTEAGVLRKRDRKAFHRRVQMVFQDPYGSLNPQHTVGEVVARPLRYQGLRDSSEITRRAHAAIEEVGLSPLANFVDKFPHQLSGGQRQRVCIARAAVLEPSFLVADEPISMLDVSIKWDIIRLLKRLVRERNIALLYITHDLATVSMVCDRIAIMYLGRIVESGPVREVLADPRHPYTRALIDSIPSSDPDVVRPKPAIRDGAQAASAGSGCSFAPRCAHAGDECGTSVPPDNEAAGRSHACFRPLTPGRPAAREVVR